MNQNDFAQLTHLPALSGGPTDVGNEDLLFSLDDLLAVQSDQM